jgi:hypothetical protein
MMHKNSIASTFLKLIMLMPSSIAIVIISNEYGVIHGVSSFVVACIVGAVLSKDVDSMTGGNK